jgi:uncharacterized membrane protein
METSAWGLSLVYWLHMLATVVWIGGLAALGLLILPAARKTLDARAYLAFLAALQRRLDSLGWFSLAVLAGTGMIQMGANPNYQGFLAIQGRWAAAILLKHLVFLGMAGVSAYLTWGLMPRLQRIALLQASVGDRAEAVSAQAAELQRQEAFLLRINLILGIIILALTSVARAS